MENKKVYIVTSGYYSDYHIVGAFSTKEKAEEMLDTLDSESTIEVYALDEQVMKNEKQWIVRFYKDGSVSDYECYDVEENEEREDLCLMSSGVFSQKLFTIQLYSDSKDKAIKIAAERRNYVLANKYLYPLLFVECCKCNYSRYYDFPAYNFHTCDIVDRDYDRIDGRWLRLAQIVKNPNSTEEEFNEAAIELGLKQKPTPKRDVKVIEILPGKGEKE